MMDQSTDAGRGDVFQIHSSTGKTIRLKEEMAMGPLTCGTVIWTAVEDFQSQHCIQQTLRNVSLPSFQLEILPLIT